MDQEQLRTKVGEVSGKWSSVSQDVLAVESKIDSLSSLIESAKSEIQSLIEERRATPRRERQYFRDLIQGAKDQKNTLTSEMRSERRSLSELRAQQQQTNRDARQLRSELGGESRRLTSEFQRLSGESPEWATAGLTQLRHTLAGGIEFCAQQLRSLEEVFGWQGIGNNSDEIEIVPDPPFWSILGPTPSSVNPLHLVEPPRVEPYLTEDGMTTVPTETYTVFDTIDVTGQSIEMKAVIHARALLESQGRTLVLEIGGKGLADILSLDQENRLWISEIKGTERAASLSQVGLLRDLRTGGNISASGSDPGYEKVLELSPSWLARTDSGSLVDRPSRVLKAISSAIITEQDPARKEALRVVSSSYKEAARHGFNPLVCHKELIQVGLQSQGDALRPMQMMQSKTMDTFCKEVEPDRIVQMNVLVGSRESDIFEQPPEDWRAQDGDSSSPEN
jgi:hypothetical protein